MFNRNLKALRLKSGLSQKQVADFLSVTPQSVSKWEKGEALPSLDYLPKLAECLDCDINAFFTQEEQVLIDYRSAAALFEVQTGILNEIKQFTDFDALIAENIDIVETAISVCNELMSHKTINIRCIRGMFNCSDAEARTFLGYLERCEMVDKLDVKDFYYVSRDAVEGFILVIKMQKQLYDVKKDLDQKHSKPL